MGIHLSRASRQVSIKKLKSNTFNNVPKQKSKTLVDKKHFEETPGDIKIAHLP